MNYYESAFPVYASTDGIAYEIYLAGCHGYCDGCHSKHTWDFSAGIPMSEIQEKLFADIEKHVDEMDTIAILGGEPLDNTKEELIDFLSALGKRFPHHDIYLYTHFDEDTINSRLSFVLDYVDYLKVGKYDANKENHKQDELVHVTLVSSNQYFLKGGRTRES